MKKSVFILLRMIVEIAGAELQSSVGTNAVCPGVRVTFTCTVSSNTHDWRIFNGISEQEVAIVTPSRPSATNLGFEVTTVGPAVNPITSTATVTTTADLNGTVILCRNELVPPDLLEQNTTVNIIGASTAPDITILSESSRTIGSVTIRANLQQPVYGFQCIQNYTVIATADGEEDVRGISTSPDDLFVLIPGLSVCPRQYTFTALACSPGLPCSSEGAPETLNVTDGLLPVTNITGDGGNLRWNPPQNTPSGCVTNYTIAWDDGTFTTPDDRTSIPIDNIPELDICRTYTSIAVTPIVPPFAIQSSGGERLNVTFIPSGTLLELHIPSPSSLRVELFTYDALGIAVRLHWNVTSQNQATTVNVSVSYSRSMDTCSRSGPGVQHVPDPDISTTAEVLLDDSFIGGTISFCVFYAFNDCEMRSDINMSFPLIISGQPTVEQVGRNATFTVTFAAIESSSVTFDIVSTAVVELEVTPAQGSAACPGRNTTMFPADFPNVRTTQILITNLAPGTEYQYRVRVLTSIDSNAVEIPRAVNGIFTSDPEFTGGLSIGAAVAISVILSSIVSFSAGALLAALITYYCVKGREKSNAQTCPPSSQPPPVYAEVKPGPVDRMQMKECVAYAPPEPVDKMEMKDCAAYGPVHVGH